MDDNVELLTKLMERAAEGKHSTFVLVKSMAEYLALKIYLGALKEIVKEFKRMKKDLLTEYSLVLGTDLEDIHLLLGAVGCDESINYYQEEVRICEDIKYEFKIYMRCGRFFKMLFGGERPEEELVDMRPNVSSESKQENE